MTRQSAEHVQLVRPLLPRWANAEASWVRSIVADVLGHRAQCAEEDVDRYVKLLLAEKKLTDVVFEDWPRIEEKHLDVSPVDHMRVDSMVIGSGINAIGPGARIDFAPGVTVIFGENGSGKSGFVRVLKRAAGVRTAEEILHNVRGTGRPVASATFSVTVGATSKTIEWKNEIGIAPLSRTNIFDTRGARVHVEEDLSYVYTPGELTLFPYVQNAIERVRAALDAAIRKRAPGSNELVASFDRTCSIFPNIEALGEATDIEVIRKYALLPDSADAAIDSLRAQVDAMKSTNSQSELRRARDRFAVVLALQSAIQVADEFDIAKYGGLVDACKQAAQRHEQAGSAAFNALGIPGLLSADWRAFVQAGEDYLQANMAASYPHSGDNCAYCRQPLTAMALELLKKYRDFTSNHIKASLDKAQRDLQEYAAPITALELETLQLQYAGEVIGEGDVLSPLADVLMRIDELVGKVSANSIVIWPENGNTLAAARTLVSQELGHLNELVSSLQTSIEQRQEALRKKQVELVELQSKQITHKLLPQIQTRVANEKWVASANSVKNSISSVLRSLTQAAKEASEELLNKGFDRRFQEECAKLRAPTVTLNFPGRQGQVTRRKLVATHKPSQVLSEGEQKVLALADFLAEVTAIPASSPVVFDDPITSMDYRRIHEVCNRIISLSANHQVIVFTHNIWFAAELLAGADKKKLKYYDIRYENGQAGLLSAGTHPRVDTIKQISTRVKKMIEGAEKAQDDVRAALVEKGYEELRGLCEASVEQEMFKGAVQRYMPNVMMTKLHKINVESLQEGLSLVVPVFEKACRYIASHSQPIETQCIRPTLEELKADYAQVLKAREAHQE
jgi:recombinational DNA repair ATPase RecF